MEIGLAPITAFREGDEAAGGRPLPSCFLKPLLQLMAGRVGGALQFIPLLLQLEKVSHSLLWMSEVERDGAVDLLQRKRPEVLADRLHVVAAIAHFNVFVLHRTASPSYIR